MFDNQIYKIKKYFKNLFTKKGIKNFVLGSTTTRKIFRLYFLVLLLFSILLYLPISLEPFQYEGFGGNSFHLQYVNNQYVMTLYTFDGTAWTSGQNFSFNFFDCLFTAFSAFTNTGLNLAPTNQLFSTFGNVVLMFLIQIGGFGIMFFLFLIWRLFNKNLDKVSINQILIAQSEKGNLKLGDTQKMLITSSIFILLIEFIFGLFFSLWFLKMPAYINYIPTNEQFTINSSTYNDLYNNPGNAFLAGFFHSVSSINNAGFDIIGEHSLAAYRNDWNSIFLFMTTFLFTLGGIGFPVVYDVMRKFDIEKKKFHLFSKFNITLFKIKRNAIYKISLLTKIVLWTSLILGIFSIVISFIFECTSVGSGLNYLWNNNTTAFGRGGSSLIYFNKSVNIMFQALTTRSAGFSTFDNSLLNPSTKLFNIFLMYIGGAPSSTAGGIRVTTLAIVCLAILARFIGRRNLNLFKKAIPKDNIINACIVSFIGLIILCLGGVILISNFDKGDVDLDSFTNALFVSASSFGTTGLSTIPLTKLNWFSKLYLMILMFIGQYGISSTLLVFRRSKVSTNNYQYLEEGVRIG